MYSTLDQLVGYLTQFRDEDPDNDDLETLDEILARASASINIELDVDADLTAAAVGEQVVYGKGTFRLVLPAFIAGSVTGVTAPSGHTVPDYIEQDGALLTTDATGILASMTPLYPSPFSAYAGVWQAGVPYTVEATFGYSTTVMTELEQACLEGAVALWRYKDAGGSQEIGEGDSVVVVRGAWSPKIKSALAAIREKVHGKSVGVF